MCPKKAPDLLDRSGFQLRRFTPRKYREVTCIIAEAPKPAELCRVLEEAKSFNTEDTKSTEEFTAKSFNTEDTKDTEDFNRKGALRGGAIGVASRQDQMCFVLNSSVSFVSSGAPG